jgi:hypothetical protein
VLALERCCIWCCYCCGVRAVTHSSSGKPNIAYHSMNMCSTAVFIHSCGPGKEFSIEQALDKMQNELGAVVLGVLAYRETGTYIIKALLPGFLVSSYVATCTRAVAFWCSALFEMATALSLLLKTCYQRYHTARLLENLRTT